MGTLSYTATMSLDGFVADADGDFQWAAPSPEIFALHLGLVAAESAEVLGRETYELMRYWQNPPETEGWSADEQEFARLWQELEKIVVSATLSPDDLDPAHERVIPSLGLDELEDIVERATGQVGIFGPTTAAAAIRRAMVEDFYFLVVPVVIGSGLRALPADTRLDLELAEHRAFSNGTVFLHYRPRGQ